MAIVTMASGWATKLQPHIGRFLDKIADEIADDARRYAPVDSGRLAGNIRTSKTGLRVRRITAHTPYAVYVELGTKPHIIRPNSKKALHWPGARHPVKKVNHPGTRAQPYLRPSLFTKRSA